MEDFGEAVRRDSRSRFFWSRPQPAVPADLLDGVNIMTGEGKTGTADPATAQAGTSAAMMTPQGGTTMADLEQSLREADDLQDGEARTKDGGKVAEAGAPEGDDAGKGEKADDGANAEDKERAERERLTPEQQATVDRRIGKEVAKRKSLEEQLEAAQ